MTNDVVISTALEMPVVRQSLQERRQVYQDWFLQLDSEAMSTEQDFRENLAKRLVLDKPNYATCSWIFGRQAFTTAAESTEATALWISGRPGAGKSVMASAIIEKVISDGNPAVYFFCHDHPRQTTLRGILSGLLGQLCQWADGRAIRDLENLREMWPAVAAKGDDEVAVALTPIFRHLLRMAGSKLFLVIDSIDSCSSASAASRILLNMLATQDESKDSYSPVAILTSRREMEVGLKRSFRASKTTTRNRLSLFEVRIEREDTEADIEAVVRHTISSASSPMSDKPGSQREEVIRTICQHADGMFLYAILAVNELRADRVSSKNAVRNTIQSLPTGLTSTYKRQLDVIATKWKGKEACWWIYAGVREFSWSEIRDGLALAGGRLDPDEVIEASAEQFVQETCGPLIEMRQNKDGSDCLGFIHGTVKEMLDREAQIDGGGVLQMNLAHPFIAAKLTGMLLGTDGSRLLDEVASDPTDQAQDLITQDKEMPCTELARYAVMCWFKHLKACSHDVVYEGVEQAVLNFIQSPNSLRWLVAALLLAARANGGKSDTYVLAADVSDCLWSWLRARDFCRGHALRDEVEGWCNDLLALMLDWTELLEKDPRLIYTLDPSLLPSKSRFRQFLPPGSSMQSLLRFNESDGNSQLSARGAAAPSWYDSVFAVDEDHDFAYAYHEGYLTCHHSKTGLTVAEKKLTSTDLPLQKALFSPDRKFLAIWLQGLDQKHEDYRPDVSKVQHGLQLRSLGDTNSETHYLLAWTLENEADEDETAMLARLLLTPDLQNMVFLIQMDYEGSSRVNLFRVPPWMSTPVVTTYESTVVWTIDQSDFLGFAPDSSYVRLPDGTLSSLANEAEKRDADTSGYTSRDLGDLRGIKMSTDQSTMAGINKRKCLEVFDSADLAKPRLREDFAGVGHLLGTSDCGRFMLVLRVHDHKRRQPSTSLVKSDGRQTTKLRPQRGLISLFDATHRSWVDLLLLKPPLSKKMAAWAFHSSPMRPTLSMASSATDGNREESKRLLLFAPSGWQPTSNVVISLRPDQTKVPLSSSSSLNHHSHIFGFEIAGRSATEDLGSAPILRHALPLLAQPEAEAHVNKIASPRFVSWSKALDSSTICLGGKILDMPLQDLEALLGRIASHATIAIDNKGEAEEARVPSASCVIISADRKALLWLQLMKTKHGDHARDELVVDLLDLQSEAQTDAPPLRRYVLLEDVGSTGHETPLGQAVSAPNRNLIEIGSTQFRLDDEELEVDTEDPMLIVFRGENQAHAKLQKAFAWLCHPFQQRVRSSWLAPFLGDDPRARIALFQSQESSNSSSDFVSVIRSTLQSNLIVGSFVRPLDPGVILDGVQVEAQSFEAYLTVFDRDSNEMRWMLSTTTAGWMMPSLSGEGGNKNNEKGEVPEIAWAMHPAEPLLAWLAPGHRLRISHIDSSHGPLNLAEPLGLEAPAAQALRFSLPTGRYLLVLAHEANVNSLYGNRRALDNGVAMGETNVTVFDFVRGWRTTLAFSLSSKSTIGPFASPTPFSSSSPAAPLPVLATSPSTTTSQQQPLQPLHLSFAIDADETSLRVYRLTRKGIIEMSVFLLPDLIEMVECRDLAYLPANVSCPTCRRPMKEDSEILVLEPAPHTAETMTIILGHHGAGARFRDGKMENSTGCEPIVLYVKASTTSPDGPDLPRAPDQRPYDRDDVLVVERNAAFAPKLLRDEEVKEESTGDESNTTRSRVDLAAFEKSESGGPDPIESAAPFNPRIITEVKSSGRKLLDKLISGIEVPPAGDAVKEAGEPSGGNSKVAESNGSDPSHPPSTDLGQLANAFGALRDAAVKQPLLKVTDFWIRPSEKERQVQDKRGQERRERRRLEAAEVEGYARALEEGATRALRMGPHLEEVSRRWFYVFKRMDEDAGENELPFNSWDEMRDILRDLNAQGDSVVDHMRNLLRGGTGRTGADNVGIGCNVPVMLYTFCFPHDDRPSTLSGAKTPDFSWTLALDVGWIEQDGGWWQWLMFQEDSADSRSWYNFPSMRKSSQRTAELLRGKDAVSRRFRRVFGEFLQAPIDGVDSSAGSDGVSRRGGTWKIDGEEITDDLADVAEKGTTWDDFHEVMSDTLPEFKSFYRLRAKAILHESFLKDLDDLE
jgi:hypothetical protein